MLCTFGFHWSLWKYEVSSLREETEYMIGDKEDKNKEIVFLIVRYLHHCPLMVPPNHSTGVLDSREAPVSE